MHSHLVAVEVGVERRANQRVNLDGLAFHQQGLKGLNAQAVKRGSAVEQDGVVLDDFFQDIPHHRFLPLHHFLGGLDGGAVSGLFQPVVNERLEKFQRHLLGKTALVEFQLRTHHDDGAAGVVHALAQQVLPEAPLLAFEGVGQRFQGPVVGAAQHTSTTAVVEQRIHRLLEHAFFVAHNDVGGMQLHQLLQPVVAVDHPAIEVVEIGGGEPAAIQGHEGPQLRRDHRNHIQNHPLRLVAGLAERLQNLQTLGILDPFLLGRIGLHSLPQFLRERINLHCL